jgi:chemotaxis methyl-accepting protein methylase
VTAALGEIAMLVQRESGVLHEEARLDALAAALRRIDPDCDSATFLGYLRDPSRGAGLLARLLDEVTVKETFFLRDATQLDQIQWPMLLSQARTHGATRIHVWTAGCATGEEAYSLALLACESFNTDEPPVRILATDISGAALAAARQGEYRPRSTRSLRAPLRKRYFRESGDKLIVNESLRALVTFALHNVVRDPMPPLGERPFDLILCRNVLIYFAGETARRVLTGLERALTPAGTLILGAADALFRENESPRAQQRSSPVVDAPSFAGTRAFRRPLRPDRSPDGDDRMGTPAGDGPGASKARAPRICGNDPPEATRHFLHGLAEAKATNISGAITAFRAALYADPFFGLAAFQLGRSYEAIGNENAARLAYERALAHLDPNLDVHVTLLEQIDLEDVKAAVRMRLECLAAARVRVRAAGPVDRRPLWS